MSDHGGEVDELRRTGRRFRTVLAVPEFRRIVVALALSEFGDWLYNVALLVYVYDATGSAGWVAAATIVRLGPKVLLGPIGGALAERYPVRTVLIASGVLRGTVMAAIATVAALDGSPLVVLVLVVVATAGGTVDVPALGRATPAYLPESQLASANALVALVSNVAVVTGPAVSGLMVAIGSPAAAFAGNAATFFAAAAIMARLPVTPTRGWARAREWPSLATQIGDGVRTIRENAAAFQLVVVMSPLTTAMYGASTVLYVLLSAESYDAGDGGVGVLYAALGIGGVLATFPAARAADSRRPMLLYTAAVVLAGGLLASLGLVASLRTGSVLVLLHAVAFVATGIINTTVLQRVLPQDAIGRVLGLLRSMSVLGMVVAAAITPPLVAALGLARAVAVVGLVPAAICLLLLRRSAGIDRDTEVRRARIAPFLELLRNVEAFADSTGAALELLAGAGERVEVPADELVIVEGQRADWFYVVVDGSLEVTTGPDGRQQRVVGELTAGDGFGEIGLLRRSPRTASVRTTSPTVLHRYPGSAFVAAVEADERAGLAFERGMVTALRSSHPELADRTGAGDDGSRPGGPGAGTSASGDPPGANGALLHARWSRRRSRRSRSR